MRSWNSAFNAQGSSNYSSCTGRRSGNICSNSGGAQEKGKRGSEQDETQFTTNNKWCISDFHPSAPPSLLPTPGRLMYFFAGFVLECHPILDETQGSSGCVLFLTLQKTLIYLLSSSFCLSFIFYVGLFR